jgi:hypothetical protein
MKPTFLVFAALTLTCPLIATAKSHKSQSKGKKPATMMKAEADAINFSVKDANGSTKNYRLEVPATAGQPENLPYKMSDTVAALAALHWAQGFYNATNMAANSVEHKVSSVQFPYYLVNMTGTVGGSTQPLYAVVLENGELVRPVEVSATAAPQTAKPKPAPKKAKS